MIAASRLQAFSYRHSDAERPLILATLIEADGREHCQIDAPDPIEAIKVRMEQQGFTQQWRIPAEYLIGAYARET